VYCCVLCIVVKLLVCSSVFNIYVFVFRLIAISANVCQLSDASLNKILFYSIHRCESQIYDPTETARGTHRVTSLCSLTVRPEWLQNEVAVMCSL
jgi:hypothetical protein